MLEFFPKPSPAEHEVRETAKKILAKSLFPHVVSDDQNSHFRREVFNELAQAGLVALMLPKEYGGGARPSYEYYSFIEELTRVSMAMSVAVGVTNLTMGGILTFGNAEQKKTLLPKLTSGEWLGAFSLSEPGAGSDAASLRIQATKVSGGYELKGNKLWCSSAGHADLYLLIARTGTDKNKGVTAFLVPKDLKGFSVGKQEKKLGLRASPLAELIFDNAFVPDSARLGDEGQGLKVAFGQLDLGRIGIGACALGAAVEALDCAWAFRLGEEKKGVEFLEGEQQLLAGLYSEIQAVKSLLVTTAQGKDSGQGVTVLASHLKSYASDVAMRVVCSCIDVMGPKGTVLGSSVERLFRDVKALQIVEGTNQVQRIVLSKQMRAMA